MKPGFSTSVNLPATKRNKQKIQALLNYTSPQKYKLAFILCPKLPAH